MKWYNCYTINDSEILDKYQKSKGVFLKNRLWYDPVEDILFTIDSTWQQENIFDSIFPQSMDDFGHEVTYENNSNIKDFKGSKILIVGAGESTDIINWDAKNYDYIFSCNNFFNNPKFSNIRVSAATVGMNVDKTNPVFLNYIKRNNTLCIFEPDHGGTRKIEYDNCIFAKLRYNGRIGAVPRLILYATLWGAKEIHVVGMDGIPPNTNGVLYHSFEGPKKLDGTIETIKDLNKIILRYHKQYILFWDYMLTFFRTKFQNLAEKIPHNMLAPISCKEFPLE